MARLEFKFTGNISGCYVLCCIHYFNYVEVILEIFRSKALTSTQRELSRERNIIAGKQYNHFSSSSRSRLRSKSVYCGNLAQQIIPSRHVYAALLAKR